MSDTQHPLAPEVLPRYLAAADGSDFLMTLVVVLLVILLLVIGNFYLKLHALPERMAHRKSHTQLQIITVLAMLALFTHNNVFWIGALLLAVVKFPDYLSPLESIAKSLVELNKRNAGIDTSVENEKLDTEATTLDEAPATEEKQDA